MKRYWDSGGVEKTSYPSYLLEPVGNGYSSLRLLKCKLQCKCNCNDNCKWNVDPNVIVNEMEVTILHPCVYLNCYKKTNSAQRQTTYQWLPEWGRAGRRGHREEQRCPRTLGADGHFHSFYGINVFTGVYIC